MHVLRHLDPDARAELATRFPAVAPSEPETPALTRRTLLQAAGGLVVAIGWGSHGAAHAASPGAAGVEGAATGPLAPNDFVRVGTDNIVTVVCKHHEMGQGNTTGLASLVADELDADWAQVRTEYAPSDPKRYANLVFGDLQGTGGSSAIANSYLQYRNAGATARAMLVAAAADAWKVPASEVRTSKGVLTHASGKRATYGAMAEAASRVKLSGEPVLKTPAQFTYIGKDKASPRVDSPSKCNGSAVYTIDVKLPGLLTAVIAWPPSFGAKLVSFDAADAKKVKGVTDVVQVPEGVAVVATGTWAALQGRRALKAQWDESSSRGLDSDQLLAGYKAQAAQPGKPFAKASQADAPAAKTIEAVYEFPFLAHASMEPMNCVAWLHDGRLETWSGHQFPTFDHQVRGRGRRPADGQGHSCTRWCRAAASVGVPTAGPTSPWPRSTSPRRSAVVRRCACSTRARTTPAPACTGRCTCTRSRPRSTARAASPAGSTSSSASRS